MKFYDKFYVGFQKDRFATTANQRMLGFATYVEDNAKFKSRKETVDRWRDDKISPIYIDNKPLHGFKIIDTATRYSTSNKLFRVLDPRGFETEITAENLFDILQDAGVVKGMITEAMLWARPSSGSSKNYLISENSPEYKKFLEGPAPKQKLVPGAMFVHPAHNRIFYRYEGRFARNVISYDLTRNDPYYRSYYTRRDPTNEDYSKVKTDLKYYINKKQSAPVFVYTDIVLNEDETITSKKIHIRASPLKDLDSLPEDHKISKEFEKYKTPLGTMLTHRDVTSSIGRYSSAFVLFKDKKDSMAREYTKEELEEHLKPFERYYGNVDMKYYGNVTTEIEVIE